MGNYPATRPGPPPLDWPHYGIGFDGAVKRAFRKYATFSGRASLSEYWFFALFQLLVFLGFTVLINLGFYLTSPDGGQTPGWAGMVFVTLFGLCCLGVLVPSIAITVRRLHDAGFSGWFYLLNLLVPVVVFVLTLLATKPVQAAQYGPPPAPNPYLTAPGYLPGEPAYGQAPPPPYPQA